MMLDSHVESMKDKYAGKRIFILGNGPSLNEIDLDLIGNEYSIAMNRISRIYDSTLWRPTFFVCTTSNIRDDEWRQDILETVKLGIPVFIWDELESFFTGYSNVIPLHCTNGSEVTASPSTEWWSYDISQRVTKFGTSMIVALQAALYMGFSEIYILGADLGFKSSLIQKISYRIGLNKLGHLLDSNHFFGSYGTPGLNANMLNTNMIAAHELSKKSIEAKGVKIFNATPGGSLEVYPRVDYDSLFL